MSFATMVFYVTHVEFWWEVLFLGTYFLSESNHRFLVLESASGFMLFYDFPVCVHKLGLREEDLCSCQLRRSQNPSWGLCTASVGFCSLNLPVIESPHLCPQEEAVEVRVRGPVQRTDVCPVHLLRF